MNRVKMRLLSYVLILVMVIGIASGYGRVSFAASLKAPVLSKNAITLACGAKKTLTVKNITKDDFNEIYATTSDHKVASVKLKVRPKKTKMIVEAHKTGKATINIQVSLKKPREGKKGFMLKCVVKVKASLKNSRTVCNQQELKKALKELAKKKKATLTIGEKTQKLDIPKGKYPHIDLIVDAPNADIVNSAVFRSIQIKAIASDTWTEKADGNIFSIDAAVGRIVIPADAKLEIIQIRSDNSSLVLDVQGLAKKIVVDGRSRVEVKVTGVVSEIQVNNRASINIQGKSDVIIPMSIGNDADGTIIKTNTPVSVDTSAVIDVTLEKGADGSTVKAEDTGKNIEVTNQTDNPISYTTPSGDVKNLPANTNATYDGKGAVVSSTTQPVVMPTAQPLSSAAPVPSTKPLSSEVPNAGSSGGGGGASGGGSSSSGGSSGSSNTSGSGGSSAGGSSSSSSGNLVRTVTSFVRLSDVDGGIFGESVKSKEQLDLPTYVTANTNIPDMVVFPVLSWKAPQNYKGSNSTVGDYRFTAVLDLEHPNKVCTVPSGLTATVIVRVFASGEFVVTPGRDDYTDDQKKDLKKIELLEKSIVSSDTGTRLSFRLKNNSSIGMGIKTNIRFFPDTTLNGESLRTDYEWIAAGKEFVLVIDRAQSFTSYQLTLTTFLDGYRNGSGAYSDCSDITVSKNEGAMNGRKYNTYSLKNSGKYYDEVMYQVVFRENGIISRVYNGRTFIPEGGSVELSGRFFGETELRILGAYRRDKTSFVEQNGDEIQYGKDVSDDYKKLQVVSRGEDKTYGGEISCYYVGIKNNSDKDLHLYDVLAYFYKDSKLVRIEEPICHYDQYVGAGNTIIFGFEASRDNYDKIIVCAENIYADDPTDPDHLVKGEAGDKTNGVRSIVIRNTSSYVLGNVDYEIVAKKSGQIVWVYSRSTSGVPANGEKKVYDFSYSDGLYDVVDVNIIRATMIDDTGVSGGAKLQFVVPEESDYQDLPLTIKSENIAQVMNKRLFVTLECLEDEKNSVNLWGGTFYFYKNDVLVDQRNMEFGTESSGDRARVGFGRQIVVSSDVEDIDYDAYILVVDGYIESSVSETPENVEITIGDPIKDDSDFDTIQVTMTNHGDINYYVEYQLIVSDGNNVIDAQEFYWPRLEKDETIGNNYQFLFEIKPSYSIFLRPVYVKRCE